MCPCTGPHVLSLPKLMQSSPASLLTTPIGIQTSEETKPLLTPDAPWASTQFSAPFLHRSSSHGCFHSLSPLFFPFSLELTPSDLDKNKCSICRPDLSGPISSNSIQGTTLFSLKHPLRVVSMTEHSSGFRPTSLAHLLSLLCWILLISQPQNTGVSKDSVLGLLPPSSLTPWRSSFHLLALNTCYTLFTLKLVPEPHA